jgi:hypothetical protein
VRINSRFLIGLGGLLGTRAIRSWMGTLHGKVVYPDPALDPGSPHCRGQKIYLFWHEYILLPLSMRGHCNLAMLLSRHQDAEILSHVARHMGFAFVRGSTNRGGVAALRELFRKSRRMHLTVTPDGPRGPRRHMAPGPIYLASRLGLPIVLLGFGYDRPWRVKKAWDRFAIPRPCSRARVVVSPELFVPPNLSRDEMEVFRRRAEAGLEQVTTEAETWAESGARKPGEMTLIPGPFQPMLERIDPAHAVRQRGMHAGLQSILPAPRRERLG